MSPAFLEGPLDGLAPGDTLFQGAVGSSQVHRAAVESLIDVIQVRVGLERGPMSLLNRGDGLGEKNLRALDDPIAAAGCLQRSERSLVNPGHVQRLQPEAHGLTTQSARRLQA